MLILMVVPALIGAAATAASAYGAYRANQKNIKQADKQMAFQERMSSTAYQRATADMRKAGINPMLAYMQGGASSPGGARADVQNVAEGAVSNAVQSATLKANLDIMKQEARLLKKRQMTEEEQAITLKDQGRWYNAQSRFQELLVKHGVPAAQAASARSGAQLDALRIPERRAMAELWENLGKGGKGGQLLLPLITTLLRRK